MKSADEIKQQISVIKEEIVWHQKDIENAKADIVHKAANGTIYFGCEQRAIEQSGKAIEIANAQIAALEWVLRNE